MKYHKPLVFIGMAFAVIVLASRSSGVAEMLNQDRTGAPGSSTPCFQCHNTGSFTTIMGIEVQDALGAAITSYVPGEEYTAVYTVSSNGSPSGYGFQATALVDNDNSNGGAFSSPSANAQLEDVGGRHIVEHNSTSASNTFTTTWTAPSSGAGDISFYAAGNVVNGNGGTSGDNGTAAVSITLQEGAAPPVSGCTYASATNYNVAANTDDGTCEFASPESHCGTGTIFNAGSGQCEVVASCTGDLDNDDQVGSADVLVVLGAFGSSCD